MPKEIDEFNEYQQRYLVGVYLEGERRFFKTLDSIIHRNILTLVAATNYKMYEGIINAEENKTIESDMEDVIMQFRENPEDFCKEQESEIALMNKAIDEKEQNLQSDINKIERLKSEGKLDSYEYEDMIKDIEEKYSGFTGE